LRKSQTGPTHGKRRIFVYFGSDGVDKKIKILFFCKEEEEKRKKRYPPTHTDTSAPNRNCLRLIDDREDDVDLLGGDLDVPSRLYLQRVSHLAITFN
jgi:hypothetical protein